VVSSEGSLMAAGCGSSCSCGGFEVGGWVSDRGCVAQGAATGDAGGCSGGRVLAGAHVAHLSRSAEIGAPQFAHSCSLTELGPAGIRHRDATRRLRVKSTEVRYDLAGEHCVVHDYSVRRFSL